MVKEMEMGMGIVTEMGMGMVKEMEMGMGMVKEMGMGMVKEMEMGMGMVREMGMGMVKEMEMGWGGKGGGDSDDVSPLLQIPRDDQSLGSISYQELRCR